MFKLEASSFPPDFCSEVARNQSPVSCPSRLPLTVAAAVLHAERGKKTGDADGRTNEEQEEDGDRWWSDAEEETGMKKWKKKSQRRNEEEKDGRRKLL